MTLVLSDIENHLAYSNENEEFKKWDRYLIQDPKISSQGTNMTIVFEQKEHRILSLI